MGFVTFNKVEIGETKPSSAKVYVNPAFVTCVDNYLPGTSAIWLVNHHGFQGGAILVHGAPEKVIKALEAAQA
ncbi:hypothetical protein SAMN02927900_04744 [Rhizobium mongolense subsp. loessense]|uniref:Uncharacterized protein n=1 Tax=Rhizobium mongolense subsp. loessense TaxID=158890 RepID=A0A1G4T6A0_9HYPH|nr:hypothetical protein [Rhizobium mongolense]SCW76974.1 hypothetical protein SAMN02927900_04744 [Rhizobium mongolense subsp. loessense]